MEAFFEDLDTLRIQRANRYPEATDYVPQMIAMIEKLLEKGYAYKGADGSIYYSISKFPRYGCLSHLKLDELESGASNRIAVDEYDKDCASDFVLWKSYDPERDGKIFWESVFGKGRPGWHLECSTMAMHLLGNTVDIHVGGVDNIFPHHENEIAQSEAFSGVRFVKHWLHCEHLMVDGRKMSKSLGNFYTLRDLLAKGYSGSEVRYMLLHTHYRSQLNFTFDEIECVRHSLKRLRTLHFRLNEAGEGNGEMRDSANRALKLFSNALADDLNISAALASVFDFVREANAILDRGEKSSVEALSLMDRVDSVLAVLGEEEEKIPQEALDRLHRRQEAREEKKWALADQLRDEIFAMGFVIEDGAEGSRLKRA